MTGITNRYGTTPSTRRPINVAQVQGRALLARARVDALLDAGASGLSRTSGDARTAGMMTLTFQQAFQRHAAGVMSDRDWRYYKLCWLWTSHRFGGEAGLRHETAWRRLGAERFHARIDRARRRCGLPPAFASTR